MKAALLTWAKLQPDGETTQFAGQINEPGHKAQAHAPVWLEGSMSRQRHRADRHPQFPLGEQSLDLLNLGGRKLHHFCTVSAPLVRLRVVQFFGRGIGGGAVDLLHYRFQLGHELATVLKCLLTTTDHGTVEDLRGQPKGCCTTAIAACHTPAPNTGNCSRRAGMEPSMSRKGNPYDNAAMESFNATYKRECVGLAEARGGYATRAEATADFFDYVEKYYNRSATKHLWTSRTNSTKTTLVCGLWG